MEDVEVIKRFLAPILTNATLTICGSICGSGDRRGFGSGCGCCESGAGFDSDTCFGNGHGEGAGKGNQDGWGDGMGSIFGGGNLGGRGGYGSTLLPWPTSSIKSLNGQTVYMIDDLPTLIDRVYDNRYAIGAIVRNDLTTVICYIARVGNSFAHGVTLDDAILDAMKKDLLNQDDQ